MEVTITRHGKDKIGLKPHVFCFCFDFFFGAGGGGEVNVKRGRCIHMDFIHVIYLNARVTVQFYPCYNSVFSFVVVYDKM